MIRKRGKQSWQITIELARGPDGKRRRHIETFRGKRKDAEHRYAELLQEFRRTNYQYSKPEEITLAEMLDRYLRNAKSQVRPRTWDCYKHIVEKHLKPALGNVHIAHLTPHMISSYYEDALENGRLDGRPGGLNSKTVSHHHVVLRSALQLAVDNKSLMYNPVASVKPPRKQKKEIRCLSVDELNELLRYLEDTDSLIYPPAYLAASTGARLSEVLALRWSDINFAEATVTISRTLQRGKGEPQFTDVKTGSSRRQITLTDEDVAFLKRLKKSQAEQKLLLGQAYTDRGLVCARDDGSHMPPNTVGSRFRRVARVLGMEVSFHSLRHSHATILLQQGASIKFVSSRLGHSSVAFTLDIYGHRVLSDDRKIAELFREALNGAKTASKDTKRSAE